MGGAKIPFLTACALLGFALGVDGGEALFDLLEVIPFVGWVIGTIGSEFFAFTGAIILACWFYYLDVKFIGRLGPAMLIEFIPIVNAIPAYTLATALTIFAANNEAAQHLLSKRYGIVGGGSVAGLGLKSQVRGAIASNSRALNERKLGYVTKEQKNDLEDKQPPEVAQRAPMQDIRTNPRIQSQNDGARVENFAAADDVPQDHTERRPTSGLGT